MSGRRDRALALMQEIVGSDPLEATTTLSDVGFDSLAFAEMAAALEEELGLDLAAADLDGACTVGEVLRAVDLAGRRWTADDLPRGTGRLQRLAKVFGGGALRWWLALEVRGVEHVPRSGPVVLAMNHESALDIPIAVIACPRPITFMAKRELFKNAFASWALRELGGFRVDRERFDLVAVQMGLAALSRGHVLGMYPEGTRAPRELLPFLYGASWMALRTGAPLVPCVISGTGDARRAKRPRRARPHVAFEPPIVLVREDDPVERRSRAEELTGQLRAAIERRLDRHDRRSVA